MAGTTRRGTSVLVVDDDPVVRLLVKVTLENAGHELVVVGEAASAQEAVEHWRQLRPHVIVLDHWLSGPDGLEVARVILGEHPRQAIILLSAHQDETLTASALALGVRACLLKSDVAELPGKVLAARDRRSTGRDHDLERSTAAVTVLHPGPPAVELGQAGHDP